MVPSSEAPLRPAGAGQLPSSGPEGETLKTDGGGFRDFVQPLYLGEQWVTHFFYVFLMKPRSQMM